MHPHPSTQKHPSFWVYLWWFFTGHHLDGKPRTNSTWFRRGTAPSHHLNWWTGKPRFHRMLWRWAIVGIPTAWLVCYEFAPTYGVNLMVIITLAFIPYLFHHGILKVLSLIPRKTVVFVHDNVRSEDVDEELDDIMIPEQIEGTDAVQEMLDESIRRHVPPTKRTRRDT